MSASASRPDSENCSSEPACCLLITIVSNGHTAQNGTIAANSSFSQTIRSFFSFSIFKYSHSKQAVCCRWYNANDACSFAGSLGSVAFAQICPCGCGLLAPIIAPRFSKISTELISFSLPSDWYCSVHTSTTARSSALDILAKVKSCRGEKQTTRHLPGSALATSNPDTFSSCAAPPSRSAA